MYRDKTHHRSQSELRQSSTVHPEGVFKSRLAQQKKYKGAFL
jgi:hypothetical protein